MNFSFLRPLALPRIATLHAFLSTTTKAFAASTTTGVAQSSPSIPLIQPKTAAFTPATSTAPESLTYHVSRTGSKGFPIYQLKKRGGNLHQTKVRKITGNVQALRQDLQDFLGLEKSEVVVNALTKQIIIRGHRKQQIMRFLTERHF